ncbi:hypothetical protein BD626DRAFT_477268 [Schizophyllum amplum]|uniref:C2H2-type domain-containing protein n=1 Tax=Schizophyllum amplum TaxID=97359 RepID=A0A550D014_9AGAR|nr:hypothetical protein BD626DRAFT_477268 [Auriculariopsis ampla]
MSIANPGVRSLSRYDQLELAAAASLDHLATRPRFASLKGEILKLSKGIRKRVLPDYLDDESEHLHDMNLANGAHSIPASSHESDASMTKEGDISDTSESDDEPLYGRRLTDDSDSRLKNASASGSKKSASNLKSYTAHIDYKTPTTDKPLSGDRPRKRARVTLIVRKPISKSATPAAQPIADVRSEVSDEDSVEGSESEGAAEDNVSDSIPDTSDADDDGERLSAASSNLASVARHFYACSYPGCTVHLKNSVNLRKHMSTHTDARPYACTVPGCDRAYKHAASLYNHRTKGNCVRLDEEEEDGEEEEEEEAVDSPCPCTVPGCGRRFKTPRGLWTHARIHR